MSAHGCPACAPGKPHSVSTERSSGYQGEVNEPDSKETEMYIGGGVLALILIILLLIWLF
jgi:hypothetical protein